MQVVRAHLTCLEDATGILEGATNKAVDQEVASSPSGGAEASAETAKVKKARKSKKTGPIVATEISLPATVSLVFENPFHEAHFVRCEDPDGFCQHIDIRPCRVKEIRPSERNTRRVFLPESLVNRGVRMVLDGAAAVASGITIIA